LAAEQVRQVLVSVTPQIFNSGAAAPGENLTVAVHFLLTKFPASSLITAHLLPAEQKLQGRVNNTIRHDRR